MKLRTNDFQCEECGVIIEFTLDLDKDEKVGRCSKCGGELKEIIGNPRHFRHVSWSQWRVGIGK
jgi:predicted nucleic acid-binding Zn ribbon protein